MRGTKRLVSAVGMLMLIGCNHESELKQERARVMQLAYVPATHGSGVGIGMTAKGNPVTTVIDTSTSEVWAVVVRCEHGMTFSLRGQEVYNMSTVGDTLILDYVEVLNKKNEVLDYRTKFFRKAQ